jgi:hypothetical protein
LGEKCKPKESSGEKMIKSTSSFREFGNELAACDPFAGILRSHALKTSDIRCRVLADLTPAQAYYIGLTSSLIVGDETMVIFVGMRSFASDPLSGEPSLSQTVFMQKEILGGTRLEFVETEDGVWVARRFLGAWNGPEWFTEIARPLLNDPPEGQFETPVAHIGSVFESLISAMVAKAKEPQAET